MKKNLYLASRLNFAYTLGEEKILALKNIDLLIDEGEFICFVGPSGSGKSTLLNLLGLIEPPQEGELSFQGHSLKGISEQQLNRLRRFDLGFVFQNFNLNPTLTAFENVEFFLHRQQIKAGERREMVTHVLEQVGLQDHQHKRPLELSGGQRQRVAIARALVKKPRVIIADELTASLDQKTGHEVIDLLLQCNQQSKVTILLASHDPMVIELSPRIVRLSDGVIHD